jgi:hypothetical protein
MNSGLAATIPIDVFTSCATAKLTSKGKLM